MLHNQPNLTILLLFVLVFYNVIVRLAAKSSIAEIQNLAFTISGKAVVILMSIVVWYTIVYVYRKLMLGY